MAVVISVNSANADRVLMFIDWLHSSQDNYDLMMYGLKGKHYNLSGNKADLATVSYSNVIAGWWGSELFTDYLLERPYHYEPDDYLGYIKDCALENTMSADVLYSQRGYDIAGYYSGYGEEDGYVEYEMVSDLITSDLQKYVTAYLSYCQTLDRGFVVNQTFGEIVKVNGLQSMVDSLRIRLEMELLKMEK